MEAYRQEKDELMGRLIGLVRATEGNEDQMTAETTQILVDGLVSDIPQDVLMNRIEAERARLIPQCYACVSPCGRNEHADMREIWASDPQICAVKKTILRGLQDIAGYAERDREARRMLYKALFSIGTKDWDEEQLTAVVMEMNAVMLRMQSSSSPA